MNCSFVDDLYYHNVLINMKKTKYRFKDFRQLKFLQRKLNTLRFY